MKNKLVYLASPYYHDNPYSMRLRYETTAQAAHLLLRSGYNPISPICHWHPMKDVAMSFEHIDSDLMRMNDKLLEKCDLLFVLTLNGWQDSKGVDYEIKKARELGIPVRYYSTAELVTTFGDLESINE